VERKTRQRESILETFRSSNGPLSPQEVLDLTKSRLPEIGIATIYRNIKSFVENGMLQTVPVPGEPDRYEIAGKKHHHHFFCRTCHKAFEMEGCPGSMSSLAPSGFKVEQHEIYLYGVCKNCLAKSA
jgi:Fur family transcriptional regulator, ferric uptake regulator